MNTPGQIKTVSIAGAGNLAWHLGTALHQKGIRIRHIYSPTPDHAEELARHISAVAVQDIKQLSEDTDLLILCVKDDAVKEIAAAFLSVPVPMVHTSGSISLDVFNGQTRPCGVLYPLQSFRKERAINWNEVPVCIESTDIPFGASLEQLAGLLSSHVYRLTSDQRAWLHLSAVMVSNFSNLLYIHAEKILNEKKLDFSLLHPLIIETANRLKEGSPYTLQTGPAKRNDQEVIARHEEMLDAYPELKQLYEMMTKMIQHEFN